MRKQNQNKVLPVSERLIITRRTPQGEQRSIIAHPGDFDGLVVAFTKRGVLPSSIVRIDGMDRLASPDVEARFRTGTLSASEYERLKVWPVMEHVSLHNTRPLQHH